MQPFFYFGMMNARTKAFLSFSFLLVAKVARAHNIDSADAISNFSTSDDKNLDTKEG